ncbi:MAG: DNA helicase [Prevotella sp.]|nr:DNA helicase [Prevotella sp.]
MDKDKTLIQDLECEKQVIGCLMTVDKYREASEYITVEAFTTNFNRDIYKAIAYITEQGDRPDPMSVFAYLQQHPTANNIELVDLLELHQSVITTSTLEQNCRRLADLAKRRKMYVVGCRLQKAGTDELEDTTTIQTECIADLQALDDTPQTSVKTIAQTIRELDKIVQDNITGDHPTGIPTGFSYLDEKGGLQPTDLWIIAAEFSQGKTSLALDICVNAASGGYPCAFYSTEMMGTQLTARLLAAKSGISSRTIMQQPLMGESMKKYDEAIHDIETLPIYFDDTSTLSVERIASSIRTLSRKHGVKVAFIDYLQVLQTNEKNISRTEEQFFGWAARKFKNLAKELQISIVLLSQIARSKDTTEPTLSRIRGSGQITEAADVVLTIYRPEVYGKTYNEHRANVDPTGTAQIKIGKGRNIGTGDFICAYDAPTTHFYELVNIPTITQMEQNNERPF